METRHDPQGEMREAHARGTSPRPGMYRRRPTAPNDAVSVATSDATGMRRCGERHHMVRRPAHHMMPRHETMRYHRDLDDRAVARLALKWFDLELYACAGSAVSGSGR